MNLDIKELESKLKDLEDKYNTSRNPAEKSKLDSEICSIKKEILDTLNRNDIRVVTQREIPVRVDHNDTSINTNRKINTNNDNKILFAIL